MTEADLLEQLNSTGDFLWSLMQYWTSISMGILIAAHLVGKRLNIYFLAAFVTAYIVFSMQVASLMSLQIYALRGIFADLQVIANSAAGLSNAGRAVLEHSPLMTETAIDRILRPAMMLIMFVLTVFYPIYCKFRSED